jgi:hypothetical protein
MQADRGLSCVYVASWSCVVCDVIGCHKPCSGGAHVVFVEWRLRMCGCMDVWMQLCHCWTELNETL